MPNTSFHTTEGHSRSGLTTLALDAETTPNERNLQPLSRPEWVLRNMETNKVKQTLKRAILFMDAKD
ncbi:hypothetical protein EYF80_026861 [Liparis tanakae]|uniref:Uncharacterized protein n=1 Tax=Liparis tanakae TaxID=230148 RepID=A0A4Z2HAR9_9TELE|nr:hypothetical protein EYF80_026861 [Liparis tanakae]